MTKNEARDILMKHNMWRRGAGIDMQHPQAIGIAIDAAIIALGDSESLDLTVAYQSGYFDGKRSKSSIAQSIRDAAINWPQFLGDVECAIMAAFAYESEGIDWIFGLHMQGTPWAEEESNHYLTFMLLVAEALG